MTSTAATQRRCGWRRSSSAACHKLQHCGAGSPEASGPSSLDRYFVHGLKLRLGQAVRLKALRQLLLPLGHPLGDGLHVEAALARLGEDPVRPFLFLDVVLDLFLEDMHLGVEELVLRPVFGSFDLRDEQLGRVMLDEAFLELVFVDRSFARRIEDLLFELEVNGEAEADLVRQLLFASVALRLLELLEQLLDLAMTVLEKRDCILACHSPDLRLSPQTETNGRRWMFLSDEARNGHDPAPRRNRLEGNRLSVLDLRRARARRRRLLRASCAGLVFPGARDRCPDDDHRLRDPLCRALEAEARNPGNETGSGTPLAAGVGAVAAVVRVIVGRGNRIRRGPVDPKPVAERQVIDHVHHFELQTAGLPSVAVPQRDHAALLLRIEQDERAIAADSAAVTDDSM